MLGLSPCSNSTRSSTQGWKFWRLFHLDIWSCNEPRGTLECSMSGSLVESLGRLSHAASRDASSSQMSRTKIE